MNDKLIMLVSAAPTEGRALAERLETETWQVEVTAEGEAVRRVRELVEAQAEPAVVLLDHTLPAPVVMARRIRALWPSGQMLFTPSLQHLDALRRQLSFAPMIGPYWSLVEVEDPALTRHVERAIRASHKRQQLRTTLDRANVRLAQPKPVDSLDYRRLVVSERYLISLLEQSQDAIFSLDTRDTIVYWSSGAESLFQRSAAAMRGVKVRELPFWHSRLEEGLRRIHGGSRSERVEIRYSQTDGTQLDLEVLIAGVHDDNGGFIGASLALRDVTARKQMLAAERRARQEAEEMSRMKDEFMAILSHELRTPLSAVIGRTQLLQLQHADDKPLLASLAVIEKNAQLQAKLIEDLLDTSSILAGKLKLGNEALNPGQLVSSAAESVRQMADSKGLRLVEEKRPVQGELWGDPHRLRQVLYNLLANAIKFTPEGGEIRLRLAQEGDQVAISISDTGVGISAEFLPRVFERFDQEDASLNRRQGGLGLGLSIARHLVQLHGGSISAGSAGRDQGATFTVFLPLRQERDNEETDEESPGTSGDRLRGCRVLVVEDVEDSRELLTDVLRHRGAEVLAVASGEEALERLEEFRPQLLISDIGMPGMDGYALLREVRARGLDAEQLPALALTAFAGHAHQAKALLAGYQRHLPKPLIVSELIKTLTGLLGAGPAAGQAAANRSSRS